MKHLFFLGIAGFAMEGLALAAQNRGYQVSGLDEGAYPPNTDWLDDHGLTWTNTYSPGLLDGVDAVVISGQHGSEDHPIIKEARHKRIRILSFAELFGELTAGKHVIAVSGAHGKTTTTSLITWLLESAGRQPDYLAGIRPFNFESSSRLDGSKTVVVEADEYRASTLDPRAKFEYYHPDTLIITSIEHDHVDVYPDLQSVIDKFKILVQKLPKTGRLIVWAGSDTAMQVAAAAPCPVITYGLDAADYTARNIAYVAEGIEFDVETADGILGRLAVPLYGRHNVQNALAAVAATLHDGLTFDEILTGAATFKGAFRRFNLITPPDAPVAVIDDYAHHPTEVKTTIEAAKLHFPKSRLIAVFRPHTYSRTKTLLKDFQSAFDQADVAYITDIEGARESAAAKTVSGQDIVDGIPSGLALYEPDRAQLIQRLVSGAQPGDVILCMTVSGYSDLTNELARALAQ